MVRLGPMDNSQAPASILDTLRTVEFRLGLKGYNVDEVDEYLDKAAQEAEGLQEHVRQLNERLRQASERIAQLERDKRAAPAGGRQRGGGRGGGGLRGGRRALRRDAAAHTPAGAEVRRPDEAGERGGSGRGRRAGRGDGAGGHRRRRGDGGAAAGRDAPEAARGGHPAGGHPDRVGHGRREHGPAPRVGAQPAPRRALRDPQVGGRERAAGELAHGREAEVGSGARRGGVATTRLAVSRGGRRCADAEPPETPPCREGPARSDPLRWGERGMLPLSLAVRYRHPLPGRGRRQGNRPRDVVRRRER